MPCSRSSTTASATWADLQPRRDARAPQRHRSRCSPAARRRCPRTISAGPTASPATNATAARVRRPARPGRHLDRDRRRRGGGGSNRAGPIPPPGAAGGHRTGPLANDARWLQGKGSTCRRARRKLEFHYASPSFPMPRFLRYRYRLRGMDRDWIDRGNQRVAQYTNLGPGQYRFPGRMSAPGGQGWSKDATALDIEIQPLLWQRGWFQRLLALPGRAARGRVYRWRSRNMRNARRGSGHHRQHHRRLARQTERLMRADRKNPSAGEAAGDPRPFERQALEDALTGLANRRSINEACARAFDRATSSGMPLSFVLLDIDHQTDQRHLFAPVRRPRTGRGRRAIN